MIKKIVKCGLEYAIRRYREKHGSYGYKRPYYKKRKKFKLKDLFD
jgi:hypothetical protein